MKSTMFTCRCCASSISGWGDGHVAAHGWHHIDGIDGPNMICPACYDEPDPLESLRADGYDARIGLPCPVRDAPPAVVTIPAAELARLREIERCADMLVDDPGSLAKQDNLRAALAATSDP